MLAERPQLSGLSRAASALRRMTGMARPAGRPSECSRAWASSRAAGASRALSPLPAAPSGPAARGPAAGRPRAGRALSSGRADHTVREVLHLRRKGAEVDRAVPGDGEQPGPERALVTTELVQARYHLHPGFAGDVVGGSGPDDVQVPEQHRLDVAEQGAVKAASSPRCERPGRPRTSCRAPDQYELGLTAVAGATGKNRQFRLQAGRE
jgi:hypothetical protein